MSFSSLPKTRDCKDHLLQLLDFRICMRRHCGLIRYFFTSWKQLDTPFGLIFRHHHPLNNYFVPSIIIDTLWYLIDIIVLFLACWEVGTWGDEGPETDQDSGRTGFMERNSGIRNLSLSFAFLSFPPSFLICKIFVGTSGYVLTP